jgi:hypothetical protein
MSKREDAPALKPPCPVKVCPRAEPLIRISEAAVATRRKKYIGLDMKRREREGRGGASLESMEK